MCSANIEDLQKSRSRSACEHTDKSMAGFMGRTMVRDWPNLQLYDFFEVAATMVDR